MTESGKEKAEAAAVASVGAGVRRRRGDGRRFGTGRPKVRRPAMGPSHARRPLGAATFFLGYKAFRRIRKAKKEKLPHHHARRVVRVVRNRPVWSRSFTLQNDSIQGRWTPAHRPPARETAPGAGLHHSICSAGPAATARRRRRPLPAVPVHGTRGGQPHRASAAGVPGRSQHLLRRGRLGGVWEVDRQRQLRSVDSQPAQASRAGGGGFQSPDCLGGHRRGLGHPR